MTVDIIDSFVDIDRIRLRVTTTDAYISFAMHDSGRNNQSTHKVPNSTATQSPIDECTNVATWVTEVVTCLNGYGITQVVFIYEKHIHRISTEERARDFSPASPQNHKIFNRFVKQVINFQPFCHAPYQLSTVSSYALSTFHCYENQLSTVI